MSAQTETYLHFDHNNERFLLPVTFTVVKKLDLKLDQKLYLSHGSGILVFYPEHREDDVAVKLEQVEHSKDGYFIAIHTKAVAKSGYRLRAYPKSPAALNVIHAHAKCSIAR